MVTTKKVWKIFFAWQDNKEEEWLQEMTQKGWALKKSRFVYTFEKIEPSNYVYKLDYKTTSNKDLEEYKAIFEDAGWEHVTQFGSWHYFRTKASNAETPDIYSDNESKIQKYKGLMHSLLVGLLAMLVLSLNFFFNQTGDYTILIKGFYIGILALLVWGIWRVQQKINLLKDNR
ncbi:DUF2812 domain-containing protein [Neobacillus sp. D3-1R]|uniref:DUF2812 domain-containing protein n=1 Tax=Neobacillus sp. D3-1R TaxID=3445778 RepID=UPI003FA10D83